VAADCATKARAATECEAEISQRRPHRISWARLLRRLLDIDMRRCPNCGAGKLNIIAAILERAVIGRVSTHLGLPTLAPRRSARRQTGSLTESATVGVTACAWAPRSCRAR